MIFLVLSTGLAFARDAGAEDPRDGEAPRNQSEPTFTTHLSPSIWVRGTKVVSIVIDNPDGNPIGDSFSQELKDTLVSYVKSTHTFSTNGLTLENCYFSGNYIVFTINIADNADLGEGALFLGPDQETKLKYIILSDFTPNSGIQGETIQLSWEYPVVLEANYLTPDGEMTEEIKQFFMNSLVFSNSGVSVTNILKPQINLNNNTTTIIFEIYIAPDAEVGQGYIQIPSMENVMFDFEVKAPVQISYLSPSMAPANTQFTIYGQDFGQEQGNSYVYFGDTSLKANIINWGNTEINAIVPNTVQGNYEVKIIKVPDVSDLSTIQESNTENFSITAIASATQATIYPNPFDPNNETVTIAYNKGSATNVGIYLYSATAKLVYNTTTTAAQITWDGKDNGANTVADGVYLARVVDENSRALLAKGKVLVVK